ncbi:hypothetical protein [Agrococcus sp. DT81.2]|uniref:hypothetical protein n=1 Tax=Agrococcus sp. DT81.2 TaxID=3393414 RepID=UPI003CE50CF1
MSADSNAYQVVRDFAWHAGDTDEQPAINRIKDLAALRAAVEEQIGWAVDNREADGLTWQQVADALGVTRQSAHARYSKRTR